jgi:hypothetical protein
MAAISKGDAPSAAPRVDQWLQAHPKDEAALNARWLIAAASADWKTSTAMQKTLLPIEGSVAAWSRKMSVLHLQDDPAYEASVETAMRDRSLHSGAVALRAERYIEKGEFAPAAQWIEAHEKELGSAPAAVLDAYAAGGMMLRGQTADATKLLDTAEKKLGNQTQVHDARVAAMMIGGLRGSVSPAEVMRVGYRDNVLANAWFVTAVRAAMAHDKAGAATALDRCRRSAAGFAFPYVAAKSLEGVL